MVVIVMGNIGHFWGIVDHLDVNIHGYQDYHKFDSDEVVHLDTTNFDNIQGNPY